MIFAFLERRRRNRAIVHGLYRQLTGVARNPVWYERMEVPDTVMGRFEMLSVVMVLFFRRTDGGGVAVKELAQDVVDRFFEDMDHCLRELGVGDKSVPRRMRRLARMFYGRARSCGTALNDGDMGALAEALGRNIHPPDRPGASEPVVDMAPLAVAVRRLDTAFASLNEEDLLAGRLKLDWQGVVTDG